MKSVNNELYDMLMGMTKVEIDFYRKILRCNASSNLKKADMAAKVVECIENDSEHWLVQFPMWELQLLSELVANRSGCWSKPMYQPMPSILHLLNLIDVEIAKDSMVRYRLSKTMRASVKKGIDKAIAYTQKYNYPLYEKYAFGMLNLYGIVPQNSMWDMLTRVATTMGKAVGEEHQYVINACKYVMDSFLIGYNKVRVREIGYIYHPALRREFHYQVILKQLSMDEPKRFTDEQILEAGEAYPYIDFCHRTSFGKNFSSALGKLGLEGEALKVAYKELFVFAQEPNSDLIETVMNTANQKFSTLTQLQEICSAAVEFSNNIPRWELNGYSSSEIHQAYMNPMLHPDPDEDWRRERMMMEKVGRNDPCPCGSGKKYKNCHGRLS